MESLQGQVTTPVEGTSDNASGIIKVCADVGEHIRALFDGSQLVLGEWYFTPGRAWGGGGGLLGVIYIARR